MWGVLSVLERFGKWKLRAAIDRSAGAVGYTDCIFAEG